MSGSGPPTGIRQSTKPTRRRRAAFRKIRAADGKRTATTRASRRSKFPARSQRRLASVRAELLPPLPAGRAPCGSRSIRRRATSDFAVSFEERGGTIMNDDDRQVEREDQHTQSPQYAARRHDACRRIGAGHGCKRSESRRASAAGRARRPEAEHSRHHGRRCRLVQYRRLSPGHHVRQDAEPRQARRRRHALHRLLRRSELHRRPRQLHHRANSAAHRPHHGRPGRRRCRHAGPVGDDGADPQVDGLCHRPIRQEPSRRLEQISADAARLRRILRLPLSPRRDVRSVLVRLPAGLDRQIRPAQPGAFLRDRHRRSRR